jgi:diaminohydroxyphosphoribosylaminopyrimidine deaminase/5-amino-6-(5-phosphoribosylamino)uracil reductase
MNNNMEFLTMKTAVELSKKCPTSKGAYSVGAIIVGEDGEIITTGYSRETADNVHAEEVAINKAVEKGISLKNTTMYSTMEPCGLRLSGKTCCADLILMAGIKKVIYAINEPPYLVESCTGAKKLAENKVEVYQINDFDKEILEINKHIK